MDLNHGPLGYEPSELPSCSTPRRLLLAALSTIGANLNLSTFGRVLLYLVRILRFVRMSDIGTININKCGV